MSKRLTIEYLKTRTKEISDCELLSDSYGGNQAKLRFRCACGAEFLRTWNEFQDRGRTRCNACAKARQYAEKRLSVGDIHTRLSELGCTWLSGDYVNQKSKITVRCRCGHLRTGTFTNIVDQNPSGLCTHCARSESQKLTLEIIRTVCAVEYDLECLENEYVSSKTPMRFRCSCGREFTACWNNVSAGGQRKCEDCSGAISTGEKAIRLWLDAHGVRYEREKRFPDCGGKRLYRFDFFLPELNTCIEFDGEGHSRWDAFARSEEFFQEQRARDAAKNAYCAAKGIQMIRIPYRALSQIGEILEAMLIPR